MFWVILDTFECLQELVEKVLFIMGRRGDMFEGRRERLEELRMQ